MAKKLNKAGKKLIKKKTKDGRVRAYWTGRQQKDLKQEGHGGSGIGGKLLAGAAALGLGALALRHRGTAGVWKGSVAHQGPASGHAQSGGGLAHRLMSGAKEMLSHRMRGEAGALSQHMMNVAGGAALSHLGARFGQTAGTAIGGMIGGPGGAALGNFLGGHAGEFLANRHGSGAVSRLAEYVSSRIQGNHVPNQTAGVWNGSVASGASQAHQAAASYGGPHASMTPHPQSYRNVPPVRGAPPHVAASHAAHQAPASQQRSFAPMNSQSNVSNHYTPRQQAARPVFGQTYAQFQNTPATTWSGSSGFGARHWGAR